MTDRLEDDDQQRQQVQEEGQDHDGLPTQAVAEVAEEGRGQELDAPLEAVAHAGVGGCVHT